MTDCLTTFRLVKRQLILVDLGCCFIIYSLFIVVVVVVIAVVVACKVSQVEQNILRPAY